MMYDYGGFPSHVLGETHSLDANRFWFAGVDWDSTQTVAIAAVCRGDCEDEEERRARVALVNHFAVVQYFAPVFKKEGVP